MLLSKTESDQTNASGFISHARRDPSRRTDPGPDFPWADFFDRYLELMNSEPTTDQVTRQLQRLIGVSADGIVGPISTAALNRNWLGNDDTFDSSVADTFVNNPPVVSWVQNRLNALFDAGLSPDGVFGLQTERVVIVFLDRSGVVAAESFVALMETR